MHNARLVSALALAGMAAIALAAPAAAGQKLVLSKLQTSAIVKNGGYTKGGDFGTVIGPKAKLLHPGTLQMLNPQPLPPGPPPPDLTQLQ